MRTATKSKRASGIDYRQQRVDRVREEGRLAALAGLPDDIPYGNTGSVGDKYMAIPDRMAWLKGWERGSREMEEMADEAMRAFATASAVATAALRYADVVHETRILRDQAARTEAARMLVGALSGQ